MADTFEIEIVTPEKLVVKDTAEEAQIPGKKGYLGILPGHAPLITELTAGELSYRNGSVVTRLALAWGFAEVLPHRVTILARAAERAREIDVARAQAAKDRAEKTLNSNAPDIDYSAVQDALKRAQVRLEVAAKG